MEPDDELTTDTPRCLNCGSPLDDLVPYYRHCSEDCEDEDEAEAYWEAERDREMEDDF